MMLHRHFEEEKKLDSLDTTNPDDPLYIPTNEQVEVDETDETDEQPRRGRPPKK